MITQEQLIEFGMVKVVDEHPITLMRKIISVKDQDDDEDEDMSICLTVEHNRPELCLQLPGGTLFIFVNTIEELQIFENCIVSYEPIF